MKFKLDPISPIGLTTFEQTTDLGKMPNYSTGVKTIVAGSNVTVDSTDPHNPIVSSTGGGGGGGSGDVVGPSSATDNAVARFDSTTGKLIQNSAVTIADTSGNMAGIGTINTLTLPSSNFVGLSDTQTLTNKKTIGLKADGFLDGNGNKVVEIDDITASTGVNFMIMKAAATGQAVIFQVDGTDTDVYANFVTKGAGTLRANGVDVATISGTQTLTNKTLTSPVINTGVSGTAIDTDTSLAANSDTKLASQKATKAYVDNSVTGLLDFKGSTDCSANPNYPSASKGDAYVVSVAGKIGGGSGKSVDVGDVYVASADNAGGTEASVGTSWFVLEHNLQGALLSANNLSDVASASTSRSNLGLGTIATQNSNNVTITGGSITGITDIAIADGGTNTSSQTSNGVNYYDGTKITSGSVLKFDGTNLGVGATPDSVLTAAGQTTIVSPVSGSTVHFIGVDASPLRLTLDTHAASSSGTAFMGRKSRGTAGSPAALNANDTIISFNGRGYGTSQYAAASTGLISIKANEAFTNTANGTYISFDTTPNGSVTAAEVGRFNATDLTLGVAGTMLGTLKLSGNTSGTTSIVPAAAASGTLTLPAATDTLVGKATTDTLTNKTLTTPTIGSFTNAQHDHSNAAGGGTFAHANLTSKTADDHSQYPETTGARSGDQTWQFSSTATPKITLRGGSSAGASIVSRDLWAVGVFAETFPNSITALAAVNGYGGVGFSSLWTNVLTHSSSYEPLISTASTTNATQTTTVSYTTGTGKYYYVRMVFIARGTNTNNGAVYQRYAAFRNNSGTITQIGTTQTLGTDLEDDSTWDATIDFSGTSIRGRVTGKASTNITWDTYAEVMANY